MDAERIGDTAWYRELRTRREKACKRCHGTTHNLPPPRQLTASPPLPTALERLAAGAHWHARDAATAATAADELLRRHSARRPPRRSERPAASPPAGSSHACA